MPPTDEFGQHEVWHTGAIFMDLWDTWVADHEATKADPELARRAEHIGVLLVEFYQCMGAKLRDADG